MAGDQAIVVTGGSVSIDFNDGIFQKESNGKHYNANKKIRSVTVEDEKGVKLFERDFANGKVKVTIHTGD